MAGLPPGAPGPGMGMPPSPQQPNMGGPPGMPPPAPPVPPMAPPPPPMGGLGPAAPFAGLLSDLPAHMGPGWQQLDVASRAITTALRSTDFQKMPAVVAVMRSINKTLKELLSHYTSGATGGTAVPSTQVPANNDSDEGASPSTDADAMPSASAASEPTGEDS